MTSSTPPVASLMTRVPSASTLTKLLIISTSTTPPPPTIPVEPVAVMVVATLTPEVAMVVTNKVVMEVEPMVVVMVVLVVDTVTKANLV